MFIFVEDGETDDDAEFAVVAENVEVVGSEPVFGGPVLFGLS
jgi:hypothetical protein